jgi:hypothetical protein
MNFFYQDLSTFFEYLHSIRKIEDYISIDLKFPIKWGIPKSIADEGQLVPFSTGEDDQKGYSFVSAMTEKDIQDTIAKITKTIKMNKDKEIKEMLFKQTVDKLKVTFEKNNLEKLEKLYFDFEPEEPKLEMNENGEVPVDTELA